MIKLSKKKNKAILEKVNWEKEAKNCFDSLILFFKEVDLERLKHYNIDQIGVVDICWNEYGSDIEVDFMADNNFEEAFAQGCIMNDSAISNKKFFETSFQVNGELAWDKIGGDYNEIITIFYYLIDEIAKLITQQPEFISLPRKSLCHIGFAGFHDEERTKLIT